MTPGRNGTNPRIPVEIRPERTEPHTPRAKRATGPVLRHLRAIKVGVGAVMAVGSLVAAIVLASIFVLTRAGQDDFERLDRRMCRLEVQQWRLMDHLGMAADEPRCRGRR